MKPTSHAIAVFPDHAAAERAVRKLGAEGFALSDLSIIGKGYHTDEKVIGFYNVGDRVMFWGKRGAFWGALWGWFLGGMVLTVPVMGQVVVLGYLATVAVSMLEGAALLGGFSALGAALYSLGIPKDSVISYETALEADNFLVMARGAEDDVARARKLLDAESPAKIDMHAPSDTPVPAQAVPSAAK
ncbi:MAG: hypothetical protein V7661_04190 [Sulfitobacter sp.]